MPHPLAPLARLEGVADAVAEARAACEALRWHRALRRQWAAARAESAVRAAWGGLALDGVRVPLDLVRDVARGAQAPPSGADGDALRAAVRVQAVVLENLPAPGATTRGDVPPAQLLARLHAAAAGDASSGRPRGDEQPGDLRGLGAAPGGSEVAARLASLTGLLGAPLPADVPALVLAGVALGEVLVVRPFVRGNAPVARGLFRRLLAVHGVEPVGVAVPEARWAAEPAVLLSEAAHYATGTPDGVARWLRYCAAAVRDGAAEGTRVADAVLAGRIVAAG